jgi:hypothetical protein
MEKMAQDHPVNTGRIERRLVVKDRSVRLDPIPPSTAPSRQVGDVSPLKAEIAEALFEVHRLEAIVEDLAVVVARVGRVTSGIGDVEDRLDHLEKTFGRERTAMRGLTGPPVESRRDRTHNGSRENGVFDAEAVGNALRDPVCRGGR